MSDAGGYAHVNGVELYYETHGDDGPPLVLLHGGMLTIGADFGAMLPSLAERHRVVAVELQGHGHTPESDREMTLDNLADDVVALLGHLGIDRASFFGFSLGGLVSYDIAIRHPRLVDRLVIASAHTRPDGYHEEIRDHASMPDSTRMPTQDEFAAMHTAYLAVAPEPDNFEKTMNKASDMLTAYQGWPDETIAAITAPTLLVIGDHDFVTPEHGARTLELIPHCHLAVLPATTHTQVMTRTHLLLLMVREFLTPTTG